MSSVLTLLRTHLSLGRGAGVMRALVLLSVASDPTNTGKISDFFSRLSTDLLGFALAMAGFFFALAAIFYMVAAVTSNERARSYAVGSLYAVLAGLALALLSGTFAVIINNAVTGVSSGGPTN